MLQALPPLDAEDVDRERRPRPVRRRARSTGGGARLPRGEGRRARLARPRPTSPSELSSTTGAGRACRSTCAPASGCPSGPPRSPIQFRKPADDALRAPTSDGAGGANLLVLRIQPNEGASLAFQAKVPGSRRRLQEVRMDFRYGTAFAAPPPEAYERLLLDVMLGDPTLFTRTDEVESLALVTRSSTPGPRTGPDLPRRHLGPGGGRRPDRPRRAPLAPLLSVADSTHVDEWHGEDVSLDEVQERLGALRVSAGNGHSNLRTSVMTHTAWVPKNWLDAARGALAGLADAHPSRTILLVPDPDAERDAIDASVSVYCFDLESEARSRQSRKWSSCTSTACRAESPDQHHRAAAYLRPSGLLSLARAPAVRDTRARGDGARGRPADRRLERVGRRVRQPTRSRQG